MCPGPSTIQLVCHQHIPPPSLHSAPLLRAQNSWVYIDPGTFEVRPMIDFQEGSGIQKDVNRDMEGSGDPELSREASLTCTASPQPAGMRQFSPTIHTRSHSPGFCCLDVAISGEKGNSADLKPDKNYEIKTPKCTLFADSI